MTAWSRWVDEEAGTVRSLGRWRQRPDIDAVGPVHVIDQNGRRLVSFASNDYLGLAWHPRVVAAAHAALDRWGTGSGSARVVAGSRPVHAELEAELAAWKRCPASVLFPTGYAANLGVLTTFGHAGAIVCSDELNHASIVDGARLARAEVRVYRHRDLDHLESLLDAAASASRPAMVVTETVFSMDGHRAAVEELAELCSRRGALLVLDEAHAVLGPDPVLDGVDHLRVGTLSKTLGSLGGFVAGPGPLIDLVVNRARSFVFTTAPPPAAAAAALAALEILLSPEGDVLQERLVDHIDRLRPGHPSPIVPVLVGDEERTLASSAALADRGLLVPAIRPPTVPPGTSRLRVSLSAAHTDGDVEALATALKTMDLESAVAT